MISPKILAALALALMGSGCVTTAAEQRALDERRCRSFGFRAGTDGFAQCLLELDLNRSADRRYRFDTSFGGLPWYYGRRW